MFNFVEIYSIFQWYLNRYYSMILIRCYYLVSFKPVWFLWKIEYLSKTHIFVFIVYLNSLFLSCRLHIPQVVLQKSYHWIGKTEKFLVFANMNKSRASNLALERKLLQFKCLFFNYFWFCSNGISLIWEGWTLSNQNL